MITAKEARELVESSAKNIDDYIEREFKLQIIDVSQKGLREYTKYIGSVRIYDQFKLTAMEKAVVDNLAQLGYSVRVERYGDSYVPPGLRDEFESGPLYINYGIIVKW